MVNVAVLGYGTVGSGVVEILDKNKAILTNNARGISRVHQLRTN